MGVNCKIYLPPYVQVSNVAKIIGICAGYPKKINSNFGLDVKGITIKSTSMIEMASIILDNGHHCSYHFESQHKDGCPLLYPTSTSTWIAIGNKLVDFFGGEINPNDCSDDDIRLLPWKEKFEVSPEDDKEWKYFYNEMNKIEPLTKAEVKQYKDISGYPEAPYWGDEVSIPKNPLKTKEANIEEKEKVSTKIKIICPICSSSQQSDVKTTIIYTCTKCGKKFRN